MTQSKVFTEKRNNEISIAIAPYLIKKDDAVVKLHYGKNLLYFSSYQLLQKFAYDLLSIDIQKIEKVWYVINFDELSLNLITSDVVTVFNFLTIKDDSIIYGNSETFIELLEFDKKEDALNYIDLM